MNQCVVIGNQQYVYTRMEIRFYGGPRDGELVACRYAERYVTGAGEILSQTQGGKPGEHFHALSDYAQQRIAPGYPRRSHCYEVTARWIRKDALCLNLSYRQINADCQATGLPR